MKTIVTFLLTIVCLIAKPQGVLYKIPDDNHEGLELLNVQWDKDSLNYHYKIAKTIKSGEYINVFSIKFDKDTSVRSQVGNYFDLWSVIYKSKHYFVPFYDLKMNDNLLKMREQSLSELNINNADLSSYEYDPDSSLYTYNPVNKYLPDPDKQTKKRINKEMAEKKNQEAIKYILIALLGLSIVGIIMYKVLKKPKKRPLL